MTRRTLVLGLAAYLITIVAILWGLRQARESVIARMGDEQTVAAWQDWAEETRRPIEPGQTVERRPVKSDEPPALILMRDHFGSVQLVSLLIGSFVFAFLAFLGVGIWRQSRDPGPAGRKPAA
jgi:hypothetical protein